VCLFTRYLRQEAVEAELTEGGRAMGEGQVHLVHVVLDAVEVIAFAHIGVGLQDALALELLVARKRRRLALAQVGKDEASIFLGWIAPDADLSREGVLL